MKELIFVFLGGGLGSVARYSIHLLINGRAVVSGFPWATFTANILGSFLIGLFYTFSARFNLSNETRLLLTVGFCGGFTTFSTFSNESLHLLKNGFYTSFAIYILLSILLGILAVFAGIHLSK
ncbi:fluoride efflux transporter CrcB [Bacteroides sp. 519]|uniref:fluoride efflux transporter CrcB n=1 Tax=Bacteroides sp. 519 TaxID=2302937 RepID=UPI0013D5630D|nr:fluoride efflux transporter CrcB [Bacteroides sp. 519]NDV60716.1 fluoride efflux transporter CrcB [Bacteroides sp. 519]